jgi:two-component system cell cycle sensor histidine kinase/response regulator CckA
MTSPLRILHLEDNSNDAEFVRLALEVDALDCEVDRVASKAGFEGALQSKAYDIILSDFSMPGFDGLRALSLSQQLQPEVPFLFLSGTIGEERAVESLRKGAVDYILKDRLMRLSSAILRARQDALERAERNQNDLQIRQQAALLNQAQDAIYVRDLGQNITYWNKAAELIYGWTSAEVLGKRASDLLYKTAASSRDEIWNTVLEKGEWKGELVQVNKQNQEIWISSRRTLLRTAAGTPVAVLNINTDITEKKNLEAQVLRIQRVNSIGAMAGGIAHDLNNVLAPVVMVSELLRERLTDPQDVKMMDIARNSAQKGVQLISQILQFAKGTKPLEKEVDFGSLVEDLVKLGLNASSRHVTIETALQPDLLPVVGDPTQITQILLNLCVNARDAMPNGGRLSIAIKNRTLSEHPVLGQIRPISGAFVELSVSDTGTGISEETRTRIFEPFFTTKVEGKGTGLGLSTVVTIVRNHHGFINVESAVGVGTIFKIYFPSSGRTPTPGREPSDGAALCGHGELILVVEEELALLEMTKGVLEAHDYHVLTSNNGLEALGFLEKHAGQIALVISDLSITGFGGAALTALIREQFHGTRIIGLTSTPEKAPPNVSGSCAYLSKSCSTRDLLFTLQNLLAPPPPN